MANPTFPSSKAKQEAKRELEAAIAALHEAKERVNSARHTYHSIKASASVERRAHFDAIRARRSERSAEARKPKLRKQYDMSNRNATNLSTGEPK